MTALRDRWLLWWLAWIGACALGGIFVVATASTLGPKSAMPFYGLAFALPQWPLLRARIPAASAWIPIT